VSKRKILAIVSAVIAALFVTGSVAHATTYNFTFNSSSESIVGQLTVDESDNQVTDLTGTLSGAVNDTINGFISNSSFPSPASVPGGAFFYDNVFYPGQNSLVDQFGLVFTTAGNSGGYWNLWSSAPGDYSIFESNLAGEYPIAISGGSLNLTSVPEPSTWVMMLIGTAALGSAAYRRSRKGRSAPALA
jgi:hypothetical protein